MIGSAALNISHGLSSQELGGERENGYMLLQGNKENKFELLVKPHSGVPKNRTQGDEKGHQRREGGRRNLSVRCGFDPGPGYCLSLVGPGPGKRTRRREIGVLEIISRWMHRRALADSRDAKMEAVFYWTTTVTRPRTGSTSPSGLVS